jgi:two-component system chemotaxis response regulator CheY
MKPNNAKVLVVDDSEMIRELMCEVMNEVGITTIDQAAGGAAALDLFHQRPYDVVVTDWNMPHVSGIDLLKAIRRSGDRRDTPVLVVTADVTARRVVEAIEAGANGFIAKPFVTAALEEKLLRIIASLAPVTDVPKVRPLGLVRKSPPRA